MERWRRISHAPSHRKVTQVIKAVDRQSNVGELASALLAQRFVQYQAAIVPGIGA
jgi:hypothetical protein